MSNMIDYKCPACGGALEFDAGLQKMKCPFCDSAFDMEDFVEKDQALDGGKPAMDEASADSEENAEAAPKQENSKQVEGWQHPTAQWDKKETEKMVVYSCKSCGGEIVGDGNTGATTCPYCGNPVVITGSFSGALKPEFILPFKLDKNAAKAQYLKHIEGKFLLPKMFKEQNRIDEIKGIYVPFWLYDSKVSASATFKAEKVRAWSDAHYTYEEVSFFDIEREGSMEFNNIPCDGSSLIDDALMESIEPFDFDQAVPFESAYMAGYFADKYDVDSRDNEARINERIERSAVETLKNTINGTYSMIHSPSRTEVKVKEGRVKYALYPVWMLSTTYKGQKYTFAMNGQSGRFVGDLPVDEGKKNITFGGILAGTAAVVSALLYLFMG